ncbi:MAG: YdcF family protein [Bacteroidales bacterium]|jgi:uncharacterized SAM-binding protein YcdF (DUF218 family)|nr:YdcF family protein [Bacteroidales bacterium]
MAFQNINKLLYNRSVFFIASKILRVFLSPLVWITILLILALLKKESIKKKQLFIAVTAMFLFFSNPFIADEFMRQWEVPAIQQEKMEKYDVGILLTGMCTYDSQFKRTNFENSSDRLLQCMDLYHKGKIQKIFISGGSGKLREPDFLEAKLLYDFLIQSGIPKEDVAYETKSRNTHENAIESARYLQPQTSDSTFLLITSAYHMRRAAACYKKAGFECDYYSTDRFTGARKFHIEHLIVPSISALHRWEILFREWTGIIMYKLNGYI